MPSEPDPARYRLDPRENRRIFKEAITSLEFRDLQHVPGPAVHFVGGQPGSGKSTVIARLALELRSQYGEQSVLEIVGDDYRHFHPDYERLREADGELAAFYTDQDSAAWVEQAIEASLGVGAHVLLEGTLRRPSVAADTASRYLAHGFTAQLHVLAVHELVSRLRIARRYLWQVQSAGSGRYTTRAAHDASYRVMPSAVAELTTPKLFDRVSIYDAEGAVLLLVDPHDADAGTRVADVMREHHAHLKAPPEFLRAEAERLRSVARSSGRTRCLADLEELLDELP